MYIEQLIPQGKLSIPTVEVPKSKRERSTTQSFLELAPTSNPFQQTKGQAQSIRRCVSTLKLRPRPSTRGKIKGRGSTNKPNLVHSGSGTLFMIRNTQDTEVERKVYDKQYLTLHRPVNYSKGLADSSLGTSTRNYYTSVRSGTGGDVVNISTNTTGGKSNSLGNTMFAKFNMNKITSPEGNTIKIGTSVSTQKVKTQGEDLDPHSSRKQFKSFKDMMEQEHLHIISSASKLKEGEHSKRKNTRLSEIIQMKHQLENSTEFITKLGTTSVEREIGKLNLGGNEEKSREGAAASLIKGCKFVIHDSGSTLFKSTNSTNIRKSKNAPQFKSQTNQNVLEIKELLNTIQGIRANNERKPSSETLMIVMQILGIIQRDTNCPYHDIISILLEEIEYNVYCSITDNPKFIKFVHLSDDFGSIPYYQLVEEMIKYIEVYKNKYNKIHNKYENLMKELKQDNEKVKEEFKIKQKEYEDSLASFVKATVFTDAQKTISVNQKENELKEIISHFKFKCQDYEKEIKELENTLKEEEKTTKLIVGQYDLSEKKLKEVQIELSQNQLTKMDEEESYGKLKNLYETSMLHIKKHTKEKIELETENAQIKRTNEKLAIRAAVSFEELTPRYSHLPNELIKFKIISPDTQEDESTYNCISAMLLYIRKNMHSELQTIVAAKSKPSPFERGNTEKLLSIPLTNTKPKKRGSFMSEKNRTEMDKEREREKEELKGNTLNTFIQFSNYSSRRQTPKKKKRESKEYNFDEDVDTKTYKGSITSSISSQDLTPMRIVIDTPK